MKAIFIVNIVIIYEHLSIKAFTNVNTPVTQSLKLIIWKRTFTEKLSFFNYAFINFKNKIWAIQKYNEFTGERIISNELWNGVH